MKKIAYLYLSFLILFSSCEESFMDSKPLTKIPGEEVWQNSSMIDAYVNRLYADFPFYAFSEAWSRYSDENTENSRNQNAITNGTMSRTSDPISYWDYAYIRKMNLFLERLDGSSLKPEEKKQYEGEVRTLRAATYFEMQKRYGGVPLVDIVLDPFEKVDKKYTVRAKEEAVADFIDSELTKAIGLLTEKPDPKGRINKWTAYAYKARFNLWSASIAKYGTVQLDGLVGIPSNRADDFFTKASAAATALIESGNYSLYDKFSDKAINYQNIFIDQGNSEVIYQKVYDGVNIGHNWDSENVSPIFSTGTGGRLNPILEFLLGYENIDGSTDQPEFGPGNLYIDGFEPWKNKDPRLRGTVYFQGDDFGPISKGIQTYDGLDPSPTPTPASILRGINLSYQDVPTVGNGSNTAYPRRGTQTGFFVKKYMEPVPMVTRFQAKTNWIAIRLAEMYLIKAEAEFEMGNKVPAAIALNATRERAGISLVDENTITLDHVRTERKSELAIEIHRFWDLRRWRIAESVLNTRRFRGLLPILHFETNKYYFQVINTEDAARTFLPQHYYNSITDSRIQNNPDLVENPGY
jgi:starch-binding outer membrane protein, SusD/RagB family